ncbi:CobQ/CobB/MinD/ParA nucleotide binding domain-containing protein [Streptomyces sp. 8K308]|uniref:AAA family ATPase n=1 Tax=Streptomyces sp. 8K308 TaxID=2530388 RepID=UPI0010433872|nr:P-loop NTPase [Streptomyces sp. 8K308]TDC21093.1 CobQ/CobB/MinD/ParA nucleotide binding domain-containing protein [Streptomyces sp. 8K308]
MTTRVLPVVGDPDTARALITLLSQLPDSEPMRSVPDSSTLLDTLAALTHDSVADLPEVVVVHERVGPLPALELIREVALRFPAVAVVLVSENPSAGLYSAAMDAGARGLAGLPLSYDELAARVAAAAHWAAGVRRHLGAGETAPTGPGGRVVTVTGAKGGVGATLLATQLALAAQSSGTYQRGVILVDLDLLCGDVGSYFDVQFRRSVADLAGIADITPQVLGEAVFAHETGLSLLIAPAEGERGEDVTEATARHLLSAVRSRHDIVVVDCGSHLNAANAAAIEMSDAALLVTTPDVISVRAVNRMVRMWDRLRIRKAQDTLTVVNRMGRASAIQPQLVARITGTQVARAVIPAGFRELQEAQDAGRIQDLDARGQVRRAMWALAAEIGLTPADAAPTGGRRRGRRP